MVFKILQVKNPDIYCFNKHCFLLHYYCW